MEAIFIGWLFLAFVIGAVAATKGKAFGLWFVLSLFLSPLVAGFCLIITLMPSRNSTDISVSKVTKDDFDEKWSTLITYDEGTKNAVKQLEPYGSDAIEELKKVFRATNDPSRLQLVVDEIAKNIQIKNEIKKQQLAEQVALEIQNKIKTDKIRFAKQIAKQTNMRIWKKRAPYIISGIIFLCIVCGSIVVKYKMDEPQRNAIKAAERVRAVVENERANCFIDPQTGLMWAGNGNIAGKGMDWYEAMSWAENLNYAGYSDWRLPTVNELAVFAKRGNFDGFINVSSESYCSSSSDDQYASHAWYVHIGGAPHTNLKSYGRNPAWPVRLVE